MRTHSYTAEEEVQIDRLMYQRYRLTAEEIAIVEKQE